MTKISIIVPVYNTASYLKECLDSVLNQSFRDFEVICVNDGSTDSSFEILESYRLKDERIHVIHQENRGLGAARNIALNYSRGDYILFLDSDDYLYENALYELYDLATRKLLDMVIFKLINFDNDTYKEFKYKYYEMDFLKDITGDDIFNWQVVKDKIFDMSVTAPAKFFKRDLIKNINFPEGLIFEDNLFFIKAIFKSRRIYFYDRYLYHRRIRPDSIMNSNFDKFSDCIIIYDLIADHLNRIGVYHYFAEQLFNRKCRDVFKRFSQVPESFKEEFFEKIKNNFIKSSYRLQREDTLKICTERSLAIFKSAIKSNTYQEFELSVNLFDLEMQHDKLKLNNSMLKRKNSNLTNLNKEYADEIQELQNVHDFDLVKFLKKIFNLKD